MKTAFLLGAGASIGAGLPSSNELTYRIFKEISKKYPNFKAALSVAIGGVAFNNAISNNFNPYQKVDIEQVHGSLMMLANRSKLEISPFISSWHNAIDEIERETIPNHEISNMYDVLAKSLFTNLDYPRRSSNYQFINAFRQMMEKSRKSNKVYSLTAEKIVNLLIDILWIDGYDMNLSYLDPLKIIADEQNSLTIYSLNYDNVIEQWALKNSISFSRGLEGKFKGQIKFNPDAKIKLFKLHGSLDWIKIPLKTDDECALGGDIIQQIEIDKKEAININYNPAVIFGYGNKLTVEGPFLDIITSFQDSLFSYKELVVVGYSFRDQHINHYIAEWFNASTDNKLFIINGPRFRMSQVNDKRLKKLGHIKTDRFFMFTLGAKDGLLKLLNHLKIQ